MKTVKVDMAVPVSPGTEAAVIGKSPKATPKPKGEAQELAAALSVASAKSLNKSAPKAKPAGKGKNRFTRGAVMARKDMS